MVPRISTLDILIAISNMVYPQSTYKRKSWYSMFLHDFLRTNVFVTVAVTNLN